MQSKLNHAQILSAAKEVVELVASHTHDFLEGKSILRASLAAFAGGVIDAPVPEEAEKSVSATP